MFFAELCSGDAIGIIAAGEKAGFCQAPWFGLDEPGV